MNRTLLAALCAILAGCNTASTYAMQHTIGAELAVCGGPMDSLRAERGDPWKKVVGDEEDVSEGTQTFQHELGYLIAGLDSVPRTDSVDVVIFRWGHGVRGCEVTERRLKRLSIPLGPPWDTDT